MLQERREDEQRYLAVLGKPGRAALVEEWQELRPSIKRDFPDRGADLTAELDFLSSVRKVTC